MLLAKISALIKIAHLDYLFRNIAHYIYTKSNFPLYYSHGYFPKTTRN